MLIIVDRADCLSDMVNEFGAVANARRLSNRSSGVLNGVLADANHLFLSNQIVKVVLGNSGKTIQSARLGREKPVTVGSASSAIFRKGKVIPPPFPPTETG